MKADLMTSLNSARDVARERGVAKATASMRDVQNPGENAYGHQIRLPRGHLRQDHSTPPLHRIHLIRGFPSIPRRRPHTPFLRLLLLLRYPPHAWQAMKI